MYVIGTNTILVANNFILCYELRMFDYKKCIPEMSPLRWGSVTLLCFGFVFLDSAGDIWGVIAVYFSSLKTFSWAGSFIFAGL